MKRKGRHDAALHATGTGMAAVERMAGMGQRGDRVRADIAVAGDRGDPVLPGLSGALLPVSLASSAGGRTLEQPSPDASTAAMIVQRGRLHTMLTPDTDEMLAIDRANPSQQTLIVDTRPCEDRRWLTAWRGQYRHIGPYGRLDLGWLLKLGWTLIVLGRSAESSIEESEAS